MQFNITDLLHSLQRKLLNFTQTWRIPSVWTSTGMLRYTDTLLLDRYSSLESSCTGVKPSRANHRSLRWVCTFFTSLSDSSFLWWSVMAERDCRSFLRNSCLAARTADSTSIVAAIIILYYLVLSFGVLHLENPTCCVSRIDFIFMFTVGDWKKTHLEWSEWRGLLVLLSVTITCGFSLSQAYGRRLTGGISIRLHLSGAVCLHAGA